MQYAKAVYVMTNNLTLFENIVSNVNNKSVPVDYLSLSFINSWLIGFIMAEGSFSIDINNQFSFSVSQKGNYPIFEAILKFFSSKCGIHY